MEFKTIFYNPALRLIMIFSVVMSLLVQVNTVFACDFMPSAKPMKHCCCGDDAIVPCSGRSATDQETEPDIEQEFEHATAKAACCCDISTQLQLESLDLNDEHDDDPVLVLTGIQLTFIAYYSVSILDGWAQPDIQTFGLAPPEPETASDQHIYLTTQRLRI